MGLINKLESIETRNLGHHLKVQAHAKNQQETSGFYNWALIGHPLTAQHCTELHSIAQFCLLIQPPFRNYMPGFKISYKVGMLIAD